MVTTQTNDAFGFLNSTFSYTSDFIGDTTNSMAFGYGSNAAWSGSGVGGTTTAPQIIGGHVYAIALDLTNLKAWAKDLTAAGNWNNNASADPASNVNGASLSTGLLTGSVFLGATMANGSEQATFNFGASAYTGTPPTGFGNW